METENHFFQADEDGVVVIEAVRVHGKIWGTFEYWISKGRCVIRGEKAHPNYIGPESMKAMFSREQTDEADVVAMDELDWFDFGDRDDVDDGWGRRL